MSRRPSAPLIIAFALLLIVTSAQPAVTLAAGGLSPGVGAVPIGAIAAAGLQPVTGPDQFPLAPCRPSAIDPKASQNVPAHPAPEVGTYLQYGNSAVKVEHNDNCWSPSQISRMENRRDISDITEVVIHWTDLDYQRSLVALRRGVSVHWLIPLAASPAQPPVELIDPRNAAWHAGPLNAGLWQDPAHALCVPGEPCRANGNVHSLGFENEGSGVPDAYQVDVMADIMAGLIREGYPIRLDRQHVVGHRELNRQKSDPGDLDLNFVIALTRAKLGATQPPPLTIVPPATPAPTPAPSATPTAIAGTAANPLPFTNFASEILVGSTGGVFRYYRVDQPSGAPLALKLTYQGMAAPAGAVGINAYQNNQLLGSSSPAGGHADDPPLNLTPQPNVPLIIQVYSYIPQAVTYQLSQL